MTDKTYFEVWESTQRSEDFKELRRRFRRFSFPMAIAFLVWYFTFVLLMTFARDWASTPVFGGINIAFLLAILQFVTTLLIVIAYDIYSHRKLDGIRDEVRERVEEELNS
jgi:Predicted membrane protein